MPDQSTGRMGARGEIELTGKGLLSPADIARLMQMVEDLSDRHSCPPAHAIDLLARAANAFIPARQNRLGAFVERLRRMRMRRNELIGAPLFRDPAWDMLLDLYVAHEKGEKVSVSSLCYASGVPQSTALRQLSRLEAHGLVTREGDPNDMRRSWVSATPDALSGVGTFADLLAREVEAA